MDHLGFRVLRGLGLYGRNPAISVVPSGCRYGCFVILARHEVLGKYINGPPASQTAHAKPQTPLAGLSILMNPTGQIAL